MEFELRRGFGVVRSDGENFIVSVGILEKLKGDKANGEFTDGGDEGLRVEDKLQSDDRLDSNELVRNSSNKH